VRTQPAVSIAPEGGANWRLDPAVAGGGILLDHGWHALYCTLHWGGAASSVAAVLENRRFRESALEDTASLQLELISGIAEIYLTWAGEERCNSIEIGGEQGHIHVANECIALKSRSGEQRWACPPSLSEGSHHRDWFSGIAEDFCAAVTRGHKDNLDDAIRCAQLIDLAQRSSAAGGVRMTIGSNLAGD
jgi:predicted dehydrogenase